MHPLAALARNLSDPASVRETLAWVEGRHPAYRTTPSGSCLLAFRLLSEAGFRLPFYADPDHFAAALVSQRWRVAMPTSPPQPGDVFLAGDIRPRAVGLVAKVPADPDVPWFLAADPQMQGRPYRRRVDGQPIREGDPERFPVLYWLRFPT